MTDRLPVALLVAAVFAGSAMGLAPPPRVAAAPHTLEDPPPVGLVKAVALGRHAGAADVAWLRTAQFIGAPHSERVQYAGLEHWIDLIQALDPEFKTPYFHGSVLLSTLPGRERVAADILADAEQNLVPERCRLDAACPLPDFSDPDDVRAKCVPCPSLVEQECNWEVPLSSGFVAYFGQLDSAAGARFFCEARRRGGPQYLTPFAARLTNKATSCKQLREDLGGVVRQSGQGGSELLQGGNQQLRVLLRCEEEALKHAAQVFRLRKGDPPTSVRQLLEEGILESPPWVPQPGLCWNREAGSSLRFELGPCRESAPTR